MKAQQKSPDSCEIQVKKLELQRHLVMRWRESRLYVSNDGALHIYVQLFFHDKVRDDFDFVWDKQIDKLDGLIEFFTIKIPQRKNKEQPIVERAAISAFYAEIGNENCHNWEIPIKQDIIKRLRVVCMILAYMCDEYVSNKT